MTKSLSDERLLLRAVDGILPAPTIACKWLFIPLEALFHFRLLLAEKCVLNYRFCVTCQFETSLLAEEASLPQNRLPVAA